MPSSSDDDSARALSLSLLYRLYRTSSKSKKKKGFAGEERNAAADNADFHALRYSDVWGL